MDVKCMTHRLGEDAVMIVHRIAEYSLPPLDLEKGSGKPQKNSRHEHFSSFRSSFSSLERSRQERSLPGEVSNTYRRCHVGKLLGSRGVTSNWSRQMDKGKTIRNKKSR